MLFCSAGLGLLCKGLSEIAPPEPGAYDKVPNPQSPPQPSNREPVVSKGQKTTKISR